MARRVHRGTPPTAQSQHRPIHGSDLALPPLDPRDSHHRRLARGELDPIRQLVVRAERESLGRECREEAGGAVPGFTGDWARGGADVPVWGEVFSRCGVGVSVWGCGGWAFAWSW